LGNLKTTELILLSFVYLLLILCRRRKVGNGNQRTVFLFDNTFVLPATSTVSPEKNRYLLLLLNCQSSVSNFD
jgi:hypothetical protein